MPKEKESKKPLCADDLRHNEYYGMQEVFDDLYARSKNGEVFTDLMSIVLKRENILLAYRNIKTNAGSNTAGTDGLTIKDIGKLTPEEVVDKVRFILTGSKHGYRPRPVRRVEIPKPNGDMRPLGIPCIWDRLVQQCIKQVMEPICEAKFSDHSYGFRPNRSVEHAIAETYKRLNQGHLHYVIEFDIKGFFDNVNHQKLMHQIYSLGIRDDILKSKIKRILQAPVKMLDGKLVYPERGTPQGGIISPLLANIVLNELDHWVESNWENNPHATAHWKNPVDKNGELNKGNGYKGNGANIGWNNSDLRKVCNEKLFLSFRKETQKRVKPVRIPTAASTASTEVVESTEMMFLPSEAEVFGKAVKMQVVEGKQYAWYAAHNADPSRMKAVQGCSNWWWLRSPLDFDPVSKRPEFCCVSSDGAASAKPVDRRGGVSPCFCI